MSDKYNNHAKHKEILFTQNAYGEHMTICEVGDDNFKIITHSEQLKKDVGINFTINELAKLHQGIGQILIDNMKIFKTQIAVPMPNGMEVKDIQFGRAISEEAVRNSYQEKYGGNVTVLSVTEVAEEVAEQHYLERMQRNIDSHSARSIMARKLAELLMNR